MTTIRGTAEDFRARAVPSWLDADYQDSSLVLPSADDVRDFVSAEKAVEEDWDRILESGASEIVAQAFLMTWAEREWDQDDPDQPGDVVDVLDNNMHTDYLVHASDEEKKHLLDRALWVLVASAVKIALSTNPRFVGWSTRDPDRVAEHLLEAGVYDDPGLVDPVAACVRRWVGELPS